MRKKVISIFGLTLAMILFSIPHGQNSPLDENLQLVCECDFQCPIGDDINFYAHNIGSFTVLLPSSAPWVILNETQTASIFIPVGMAIIIPLSPSQKFEFTWNQRYTNGNPVPPGIYNCKFWYWDENLRVLQTLTVSFRIVPRVPVHTEFGILALIVILFGGGIFLIKRMSITSCHKVKL